MISNHLKTIFRNIKKNPVFSAINITGLSIAIACVLFILLWVNDEISYDQFHANSEKIGRVVMDMGTNSKLALTPPPLMNRIKSEFPEVENATRLLVCPKVVFRKEDQSSYEAAGISVDPAFFDLFSFDLINGNESTLLTDPTSIVITETIADKYFPKEDPVNQTILINGHPIKITGLMSNVPHCSHLQFDYVLPINSVVLGENDLNDWGNVDFYTYVELKQYSDFKGLDEKVRHMKTPREETFYLQELSKIHGDSGYDADNAVVSDRSYLYIFSSIALLILLIASINYITIYISASSIRSKEIGIRKVNGAGWKSILVQFISESAVFVLVAILIAIFLVIVLLPQFNLITNKQLSFLFSDYKLVMMVFFVSIVFLLSVSIYPAIHFSSLKPALTLKGKSTRFSPLSGIRSAMVLCQFAITIVLIISMTVVAKQNNFIQNKNLGFNKENILYLPFNGVGEHYESFKDELLKNKSVINITAKNSMPNETADKTTEISWPDKKPGQEILMEGTAVDFNYIETMGFEMIEGRSFLEKFPTDKGGVILNQDAVKKMELDDPVGKEIELWGYTGTIIGIVKDAILYSLKENVGPQILYMIPDLESQEMAMNGVLLIRLKGENIQSEISNIQSVWKKIYPEAPFDVHFLDKSIDSKYWQERQFYAIVKIFVILSILISCMGLFGISMFTTKQRIKEIGIRKVNGAKVEDVMMMLNKDYSKLLFPAFVVACPIAWYAMHKWLQNFAYKTDLSWWVFAIAGAVALAVALLTVSWQSWRAAMRNPVEALRYE